MISELVLTLAAFGGIRDLLNDEQVRDDTIAIIDEMAINTKDDLEEMFAGSRGGILDEIRGMIDLNEDGVIDVYELAVLDLDGAEAIDFKLNEFEAVTLADGAVREDGELGTDHVDEEHFRTWLLDTFWNALLKEADRDGDKQLSDAEWSTITSDAHNQLRRLRPRSVKAKADDFMSGMFDFALPEHAADALIMAGSVFANVALANSLTMPGSDDGGVRRRLGFWNNVKKAFSGGHKAVAAAAPPVPVAAAGAGFAGAVAPETYGAVVAGGAAEGGGMAAVVSFGEAAAWWAIPASGGALAVVVIGAAVGIYGCNHHWFSKTGRCG